MSMGECTDSLEVTFHPPLHAQRRMWILDVLRRENVVDIIDIGCGEGSLLASLCNPAPWLPVREEGLTDSSEFVYLYPQRVRGLDISAEDLEFAVRATAPPADVPESSFMSPSPRWKETSVEIWKGGLELVNDAFIGVDCIVSSEVVEHLSPDIFLAFAPMLLGVYHPRLLLITTPSFTFNARFTSPSAPRSARTGYTDPTGRTDRIFRHHDHKFEWTNSEFHEFCDTESKRWGYNVFKNEIGHPVEKDPFGRDEELGGASFVAFFVRTDDDGVWREEQGRKALAELALQNRGPSYHEILAVHNHPAHQSSGKPSQHGEIIKAVLEFMDGCREAIYRLEDMWLQSPTIAPLCGGWIETLIEAIEEENKRLLLRREGGRSHWTVEVVGGPKQRPPMLRGSGFSFGADGDNDDDSLFAAGQTSLDYIPKDWMPSEEDSSEWESSTGAEAALTPTDASDEESDALDFTQPTSNGHGYEAKIDSGGWGDVVSDGHCEERSEASSWKGSGWGNPAEVGATPGWT